MLEKGKCLAAVSSSATTSNGITINKSRIETATEMKSSTSDTQTNAMKKKSKKNKNKLKNLINNVKNTASCDSGSSGKTIKNVTAADAAQAVSDDLVQQLKINGSCLHKENTSSNNTGNKTDSIKSKQNTTKLPNKHANGANSDVKHSDGQHSSNSNSNKIHKNNNVANKYSESEHLCNGLAMDESSAIEISPTSDKVDTCNGVHLESDTSGQLTRNRAPDATIARENVEQMSIAQPSTSSAAATPPIDSIANESISSSQLPNDLPNISVKCSQQIPIETSSTDSSAAKIEMPPTPSELTSSPSSSSSSPPKIQPSDISFIEYENELQMPDIMRVIQKDLSEPYSIYTYRYFIHNWPKLCFLAMHGDTCIGAIVCKLDIHRQMTKRGYIAMLAVDKDYRKLKVGTTLVQKAIHAMLDYNADEVVLETEITNIPALRLYENLGFVRDKRLFDYYLNGVDALRLKLWFK